MRRILTAAVLLPILWLLVKRAPLPLFFAVSAIAVGRAAWECSGLLGRTPARPFRVLGVAGSLAVLASFSGFAPGLSTAFNLCLVAVVAIAVSMGSREDASAMLGATLGTLFTVVWVGLGLAHGIGLRLFPGEDGEDLLMLLFVCVIAADTLAYYVGRTLGRRRLAPRVSPKKTWAGAIGGTLGSLAAAVVAHYWFYQRLPLAHAILLGLLLALAAILGDLSESIVKRAAGAKDASSLLPGHGGLLDRVDGLLFAGPLLYYYYLFVLAGGTGGAQ